MPNNNKNANNIKKSKITSRRYNVYNETDHNARTYPTKID